MTSDEAQEKIVRDGGVKILLEMAINDTGLKKLAYQAAKTLVMIGYSGKNKKTLLRTYLFNILSLVRSFFYRVSMKIFPFLDKNYWRNIQSRNSF